MAEIARDAWYVIASAVVLFGVAVVCREAWFPRQPEDVTPRSQPSNVRIVLPEQAGEVVELHPAGQGGDMA